MIFHQIATEQGCQSYFIGCETQAVAAIVDPELSLVDHYLGLASQDGLQIHYLIDTHTHADHFSASHHLSQRLRIPVVMHRNAQAPFVSMPVDDGEMLLIGELKIRIMHTPGHTSDSMCLILHDRILTGDTLLIGATGRTDLATGNPAQLHNSLFNKLLKLDTNLRVYPAHDYKKKGYSTLAEEIANNPRLQKKQREEFIEQMQQLDLAMPTHLTEALRTNLSGAKTLDQLIHEAASHISFISAQDLNIQLIRNEEPILILDVREPEAFSKDHIEDAMNIPRGMLEFCVNEHLPDPTQRIVVYCDNGQLSTLATYTLRTLGYNRATSLYGGLNAWNTNK